MRLNTTGQVVVFTKRTATGYTTNAYTPVGTYAVGWTEYRVVLDFTTDTYTLSRRTTAAPPGRSSRPRAPLPTPSRCRGHRPHHDGQPAVPRLPERGHVARRRALLATPASSTCSAPTRSPPPQAPAARSRPSAPDRRLRRLADLHHHTGRAATRSPACSSTVSRSAAPRPTRSPTSAPTTPSPRASSSSPPAATCHQLHRLRELPRAGQCSRRPRPPVRELPRL